MYLEKLFNNLKKENVKYVGNQDISNLNAQWKQKKSKDNLTKKLKKNL